MLQREVYMTACAKRRTRKHKKYKSRIRKVLRSWCTIFKNDNHLLWHKNIVLSNDIETNPGPLHGGHCKYCLGLKLEISVLQIV